MHDFILRGGVRGEGKAGPYTMNFYHVDYDDPQATKIFFVIA
jgi:hypothetical protein